VIYKNKLYSWIWSILFRSFGLFFNIILNFVDKSSDTLQTLHIARVVSYTLFYYSLLPILLKYHFHIVLIFNLLLAIEDTYTLYVVVAGADRHLEFVYNFRKYGSICALVIELVYQMFRRRKFCFK
jgi:hypothetical protein